MNPDPERYKREVIGDLVTETLREVINKLCFITYLQGLPGVLPSRTTRGPTFKDYQGSDSQNNETKISSPSFSISSLICEFTRRFCLPIGRICLFRCFDPRKFLVSNHAQFPYLNHLLFYQATAVT